jgi:hypothetical protein
LERRWSQVCKPIDSRRFSRKRGRWVGLMGAGRMSDQVKLRVEAARESGEE